MKGRTIGRATVLAAVAGVGCGGGFNHLPVTPASSKPGNNGAETFHFAYEGGCMDIDMPQGWSRLPTKSTNLTKFGNLANGHQTAAVDRFDVPKGTSLHDFAKRWAEHRMKDLNKKSETAKQVTGEEVNEKLEWHDDELQLVTIGSEPKLHDAATYAIGYQAIKVKSDDSLAKKGARINAAMGLNPGSFSQTITTEVKVGAQTMHQYFFFNDGPAYLSMTFNARAEDWKELVPVMTQIVSSMRIGDCQ